MTRTWMWRTAAIVAAMILAADSGAAAVGGHGGPGRRGGPGRAEAPQADEEMRAALAQVMKVRLKRALQLTPEQEERVMPRVDRLQEARHDFATRRRAAVSHLRAVTNDATSRPADIEKALRTVRDLEVSFRDREADLRADVEAELDPRQRARLYFFEVRFRREMQRRLRDASGPLTGPMADPRFGPGDSAPVPGAPTPDGSDQDGAGDDDL